MIGPRFSRIAGRDEATRPGERPEGAGARGDIRSASGAASTGAEKLRRSDGPFLSDRAGPTFDILWQNVGGGGHSNGFLCNSWLTPFVH